MCIMHSHHARDHPSACTTRFRKVCRNNIIVLFMNICNVNNKNAFHEQTLFEH